MDTVWTLMPRECRMPTSPCSTLTRVSLRLSTSGPLSPTSAPKSSIVGHSAHMDIGEARVNNIYHLRGQYLQSTISTIYLPERAIATDSIPPINFSPFLAFRPKNRSRWFTLEQNLTFISNNNLDCTGDKSLCLLYYYLLQWKLVVSGICHFNPLKN